MAMPCSSAAAITSSSRSEPPGSTMATAPALAASSTPSRNGKNASDARTDPASGDPRLLHRDPHRVDARHLAGTDAQRPAPGAEHDGVRLDVLGDPPGEIQIRELGRRRRALGHHLRLDGGRRLHVAALHQQATRHAAQVERASARALAIGSGHEIIRQQPQVLLAGQDLQCLRRIAGRDHAFEEGLAHLPSEMRRRRAVHAPRCRRTRTPDRSRAPGDRPRATPASETAQPQGLVCLTIATAGAVNSAPSRIAASRSRMLLYDSSLP